MGWIRKIFGKPNKTGESSDRGDINKTSSSKKSRRSFMDLEQSPIDVQLASLTVDNWLLKHLDEHLKSGNERSPLDVLGMSMRLYSTNAGTVNLELLGRNSLGLYFKPLAYYTKTGSNFSAHVLHEFYDEAHKHHNLSGSTFTLKSLSLKENALIGSASNDIIPVIRKMFNKGPRVPMPLMIENMQQEHIVSNGLQISIQTSMMGALETNLDDEKFNLDEPMLVMYQNRDGITLHCVDSEWDKLQKLELIGAFKGL